MGRLLGVFFCFVILEIGPVFFAVISLALVKVVQCMIGL